MSIIDLQEVTPGNWRVKYRGNYGTYTIKIKRSGDKTVEFSCSCPSDYYPCKHIPIAEEAIDERLEKCSDNANVEQLLKDVSVKKLRNFIVKIAKNNPQLTNTILLEFTGKVKGAENYSAILRRALSKVKFDIDDLEYDDECFEIEALDEWLCKAEDYLKKGNSAEALSICKACIEEYADWCEDIDQDEMYYLDEEYSQKPFEIIEQIIETADENTVKELSEYCRGEMLKPKYGTASMTDGWDAIFMLLCAKRGSDEFCEIQDRLLEKVADKSSREAEKILRNKIAFYDNSGHYEKSQKIIEQNIQIESFREQLVECYISEGKLEQAKGLIQEFLAANSSGRRLDSWYKLRLRIAQIENDVAVIRQLSYRFIENNYSTEYYTIYKSTFGEDEWSREWEKLIKHYQQGRYNNWLISSVAEIFVNEKQYERLMKYVEKHLSMESVENYHKHFAPHFPAQTLSLCRRAADSYMSKNTGRDCYERVVSLFGYMKKIEGGQAIVSQMITAYRTLYKNRRAMLEIFARFETMGV